MKTKIEKGRIKWIDMAKAMAILGVMVDHTNGVLYTDQRVAAASYYSVSLFILMMGVTTYWSLDRQKGLVWKKLLTKSWDIYRPYLVATLIYFVAVNRAFDLEGYLYNALHFNMSGPFYYVLLYLQLVWVSPVLYQLFQLAKGKTYGLLVEIFSFAGVVLLSVFTTNHTNILSVYGGGGRLFGGSYLILLFMGMWFAKYYEKLQLQMSRAVIVLLISFSATLIWLNFITRYRADIDARLPLGAGFNPPSLSFSVYAILLALILYSLDSIGNCLDNRQINTFLSWWAKLGKHTLFIFLYHRFFLDIVFAEAGLEITNIWEKRVLYFGCMILGSIVFELVLERIHGFLASAYSNKIVHP